MYLLCEVVIIKKKNACHTACQLDMQKPEQN